MTPSALIIFLFLGHSNMAGDCAGPCDTINNARIWQFSSERGFYHGTEKLPVLLFLQEMSLRYPNNNFCGLNYQYPSAMVSELKHGERHYDRMVREVTLIKNIGKISGIVSMFGFIEGADSVEAKSFDNHYLALIKDVRKIVGDNKLPCIVSRYEQNNQMLPAVEKYRKFSKTISSKIIALEKYDTHLKVSPVADVPKEYYCQNHHWLCSGFKIWAHDAATIYQQFKGKQ